MKRGVPPFGRGLRVERQGYTIVEVMIFLAVTGALFAMIALSFAGQRGRTQFQTSAREIESRIRDLVNDTSTGFYQTSESFSCVAGASGPSFTNPNSEQGANQACIFIGRALQFSGGSSDYDVYTVAGLRRESTENKEVENFAEAKPQAVVGGAVNNVTEELVLPNGASLASMYYNNGSGDIPVNGFGLFTTFGTYDDGALQPGSLSVNVVPLPVTGSSCPASNFVCQISELGTVADSVIVRNPSNGLTMCINSGGSDQHAILKIGGGNRQVGTDLTIVDGQVAGGAKCD